MNDCFQVYKARLRVNGNLVAIKVQRPNCESTISLDLYVLRFYAGFLTKALQALKRQVDLTSIIDDFGELIYREIDYRAEMVNCQRFAELYANIPDVFVPKVREGNREEICCRWHRVCRYSAAVVLLVVYSGRCFAGVAFLLTGACNCASIGSQQRQQQHPSVLRLDSIDSLSNRKSIVAACHSMKDQYHFMMNDGGHYILLDDKL